MQFIKTKHKGEGIFTWTTNDSDLQRGSPLVFDLKGPRKKVKVF